MEISSWAKFLSLLSKEYAISDEIAFLQNHLPMENFYH